MPSPLRSPALLLALSSLCCAACADEPGPAPAGDTGGESAPGAPLVVTDGGEIQGIEEDNGTWRFLGIPFAEPPVGELRWRPPVRSGALDPQPFVADTFAPACPQLSEGEVVGDEDCLYLNVWAPADVEEGDSLPVMFFIHGGANILGSAAQMAGEDNPVYTGKHLAAAEDVVVVTTQYRLGPLGFLALPELSAESEHGASGSYALLDQLAALEWVQDNIGAFGGDPGRVLLFGQSGGAVDTCALYASPLADGLFSSVLMQSGFCTASTLAEAESQHSNGVAALEACAGAEDLPACLRGLPAEEIIATIPGSIDDAFARESISYGPVADGHVLPDAPLSLIGRGEHNDVPLVLGSTADEMASGNIFTAEVETAEAYEAMIEADFVSAADEILEMYPVGAYETPQDALIQVYTDQSFTRHARLVARTAASSSASPVYRYVFSKHTDSLAGELPARHGIDLMYVFNTITAVPVFDPTDEDLALAGAMMASWAALARDGDPSAAEASAAWQAYDPARDSYLDFGAAVSTGEGFRTEECDMWDDLMAP